MAKRAPSGEEPYRPLLDPGVISAALAKPTPPGTQTSGGKIVEMSRAEGGTGEARAKWKGTEIGGGASEPPLARVTVHEFVQKLDQEKRMLLTRAENIALERLVASLANRIGTQVKMSHVLRALVTLLLCAEAAVDRRAGEKVGLTRPANGDFQAIKEFEREISRIIAAALRDGGPPGDS